MRTAPRAFSSHLLKVKLTATAVESLNSLSRFIRRSPSKILGLERGPRIVQNCTNQERSRWERNLQPAVCSDCGAFHGLLHPTFEGSTSKQEETIGGQTTGTDAHYPRL